MFSITFTLLKWVINYYSNKLKFKIFLISFFYKDIVILEKINISRFLNINQFPRPLLFFFVEGFHSFPLKTHTIN